MDRVALDLGIIKIYWYGIVITLGMLAAVQMCMREFKRRRLDPNIVADGAIWVIFLGLVGARLYHVFSSPNDGSGSGWAFYRDNPLQILAIWNGGIGIYGGIIGGVIGIIFLMRRHGVPFFRAGDAIVPGVLIGQAIGRWGNFFNQELYGGPTGSSWFGLIIQQQYRVKTGKFDFTDMQTYPPETRFHPTFLYESVWNLLGFGLLMLLATRFQENPGDRLPAQDAPVANAPDAVTDAVQADAAPTDTASPETSGSAPVDASLPDAAPAEAAASVPVGAPAAVAIVTPQPDRSLLGTFWPLGKKPLRDGDIGPLYLIWYGVGRAWVELLFRPDAWTIGALPTAVWVSAGAILAAIVMLTLNRIKRASGTQPVAA